MDGEQIKPAKEISEAFLEITKHALLGGDFDAFAACFHVPHFISSSEDKTVLETRDDLHRIFKKVTQDYQCKRITDLVRICIVAEYRTPTRIEATHISHMMAGNDRVGDSYPCFSVFDYIDGRWQITSSQYAVDTKTTVGHALKSQRPTVETTVKDQEPL